METEAVVSQVAHLSSSSRVRAPVDAVEGARAPVDSESGGRGPATGGTSLLKRRRVTGRAASDVLRESPTELPVESGSLPAAAVRVIDGHLVRSVPAGDAHDARAWVWPCRTHHSVRRLWCTHAE